MSRVLIVLKRTVFEFFEDSCPTQAAALAYYTVFSLPPLLLIVVSVAASVFGTEAVQTRVYYEVSSLAGTHAADQISSILTSVRASSSNRGWVATVGTCVLLFAASTAFAQLQAALNHAWNVKPDPSKAEIRRFLKKRLISFGIILGVAFLMLVSLLLSAALTAVSDFITPWPVSTVSAMILQSVNVVVSLVVFTALFAAMYKYLPDVILSWKDAAVGGIATAILFVAGKSVIGIYLGNNNVTSVYGAAGSLAVILLWTYYSSMILLLGAEFTQVWCKRHGRRAPPEPGAMKIRQKEVRIR